MRIREREKGEDTRNEKADRDINRLEYLSPDYYLSVLLEERDPSFVSTSFGETETSGIRGT